ncbi:MAG: hypothetical protein CME24_07880 [Gemmatimonadetes bacterium]|nr:hypothetical protein [Gemmatimonadota bacterium]
MTTNLPPDPIGSLPSDVPGSPLGSLTDPQAELGVQGMLRSLEEICRDVVDHVPDIVYRLDGEGNMRLLERSGYRIVTAATGERGLEIFEAQADVIDLVLLDLSMPTMSGHEVLLRIREMNSEAHVLILTGYAIGDIDFDTAVLRKPFTIAELESKIIEALR